MRKTKRKNAGHPNKNSSALHPYLAEVISAYKNTLTSIVIFSFFINLLMLTVPLYLLQIYDRVIPNRSTDTLAVLMVMVLVAVIALGILDSIRNSVIAKLGSWFESRLGNHLLSGTLARSLEKGEEGSVNILQDLGALKNLLAGSNLIAVLDVMWTPIFILALFWLHPLLGSLVTIGVVIMVILGVINEKGTKSLVTQSAEDKRQTKDMAGAYLRNADAIQAMGMQSSLIQHWQHHHNEANQVAARSNQLTGRIKATVKSVRLTLQVIVLSSAAWLILEGNLTAGATMASLLLMQRAIGPYERLLSSWKSIIKGRAAYGRINQRLSHAVTLQQFVAMPTPRGPLTIESLRYRRQGDKHSLFSNVDLNINPGEVIALAGPTASGKSTLAKLLVGIHPPSSGHIKLDGYDLAQWHPEELGKEIGYLPQEIELFDGTIRDNISRMSDSPIEHVIEAAQLAGVHDTVQRFPEGYDTPVGEFGAHLSGGEKQRLALARAVFKFPALVVLDEPDSSLDQVGKAALAVTLEKLKRKGVMTLLITHQPDILRFVDKLFVLEERKLTEIKKQTQKPKITASSKEHSESRSKRKRSSSRG